MKPTIIALAVASALVFSSGAIFAQKGQGGGNGKGRIAQSGPKTHGRGPGVQQGSKGTKGHMPKTTQGPKQTGTSGPGPKGNPGGGATSLTLSPVQQKLQRNTNLAGKLESRLPAGTNLITAAEGFRNLGQFVAAVNVSDNLGLSFTQLKSRMVDDGMSLGQAIQSLRSDVDVTTTVRRAETDANRIIVESEREMPKTKAKIKKDGDR